MPTYEERERFTREFAKLSPEMKRAFANALEAFIADADSGRFRPSLRVKRVRSARRRLWEMSFAGDGPATFEMEPGGKRPGLMHIRWQRIGDHSILDGQAGRRRGGPRARILRRAFGGGAGRVKALGGGASFAACLHAVGGVCGV